MVAGHGAVEGGTGRIGSHVRFNPALNRTGRLEFTPEPNTEYTVVGELTENKREVWLANAAGERVGKLVKR